MAKSSRPSAAGMPAPSSIVSEKVLVPRRTGPAAATRPGAASAYRILRTTEVDPYDPPVPRSAVPAFGLPRAAPISDNFGGTSRKAAKLSIADAPTENFTDLQKLIESLPTKKKMTGHQPKIKTDAASNRVDLEKRNVRVRAFLYAASREDDADYHLIIGRPRDKKPPMYMTIEISGLPPKSRKSFARLKGVRDAYKTFFSADLPGLSYDFYNPPIPIEVEGSLFFDMSHATGQGPGPQSLRKDIPTVWEIHPVTEIVFEP
jgi:hypothetical protein